MTQITNSTRSAPGWLKPTVDYGPLAAFFIAYKTTDLLTATAALMAASAVAVALSLLGARRVPIMPLLTAAAVGVFGGLTLWLEDDTFIKMKPTIIEALFALILFGGLVFGRPLLKPLMESAWPMDEAGWRRLTLRFAFFFAAMAALNEYVWRTQSDDFWVNFKVFGIMGLTLIYALAQAPLMKRHAKQELEAAAGKDDG